MTTYDWIVVGGGLAGTALSYELAQTGASVILLERNATPDNATHYSYGGIAYWAGTMPLTRQLGQEGIELHRHLSDELDSATQFCELDLILTIPQDADPDELAAMYADCAIPPQFISRKEACEREPLLNPEAIAGALTVCHGHVDPRALIYAYQRAFGRRGGVIQIAEVVNLSIEGDRIKAVNTTQEQFEGKHVVVCAGGLSRALLQRANLHLRQYFTHAELIEIPANSPQLRTLVMPAQNRRFALEEQAGQASTDSLWNEPGHRVMPHILDAGAVSFQNGRLCLGQISRTLTNPFAAIDAAESEAEIRAGVAQILPQLASLPGTWHHCLVAFSGDGLPLIGPLSYPENLHIFSGFSNPFAILLPLARRFASHATREPDAVIEQLSPNRPSLWSELKQ
jgi:glycine/D-amino acid oxidase-like deaminating enzyme